MLKPAHSTEICNTSHNDHDTQPGHRFQKHHIRHCGKSVQEAKANGCWWDELTKAWLPDECPRYGAEEYMREGMLSNPHDNGTSWAYWWDQAGTSTLDLDRFAEDEHRDTDRLFWTTSREHLSHCAWIVKRTIYAYENGYGLYDLASGMGHIRHCVDTLYRRASRDRSNIDEIVTQGRVLYGHCSFYKRV